MDVSTLHAATEDLAAYLSEVTYADLEQSVSADGDVGDLYLRLLDRNVTVARAITGRSIPRGMWADPGDRAALGAAVDYYGGCGLEHGYRKTAGLMENAFASATEGVQQELCELDSLELATLFEQQISDTVVHTWEVAHTLGLTYQPSATLMHRVLRTLVDGLNRSPAATSHGHHPEPTMTADDADVLASILALSGSRIVAQAPTR